MRSTQPVSDMCQITFMEANTCFTLCSLSWAAQLIVFLCSTSSPRQTEKKKTWKFVKCSRFSEAKRRRAVCWQWRSRSLCLVLFPRIFITQSDLTTTLQYSMFSHSNYIKWAPYALHIGLHFSVTSCLLKQITACCLKLSFSDVQDILKHMERWSGWFYLRRTVIPDL